MVDAVNTLAEQHQDLTDVESSLLWEAYRKRFLSNFAALRAMTSVLDEEDADYYPEFLLGYNDQIRADLANVCHEAIGVLEEHLLPYAQHPENVVLYNSMIADNFWVLGMIVDGPHDFLEKALLAYESAHQVALDNLAPGHQQRLCVLLNLSAFHYDVIGNVDRAFALANVGLAESATMAMTKEATDIVIQLWDNVAKWMAEQQQDEEAAAPQAGNEGAGVAEDDDEDAIEAQEHVEQAVLEDGEEADDEAVLEDDGEAVLEDMEEADDDVEETDDEAVAGQLPYKTPYSSSPPSPLVVRSVSPVDRTDFIGSADDWGCGTSDRTGQNVIRRRKKAAQARRGMLG